MKSKREHLAPELSLLLDEADLCEDFTAELLGAPGVENVGRAFGQLRPEWKRLLWRLEVEGESLRVVAADLGVSASALAASAYRAREALRDNFLAAGDGPPACAAFSRHRLATYVRGTCPPGRAAAIAKHLPQCRPCQLAVLDMSRAGVPTRRVLGAVLVGGIGWARGASAENSTLPDGAALHLPSGASVGPVSAGVAQLGSAGVTELGAAGVTQIGVVSQLLTSWPFRWTGIAALLAVVLGMLFSFNNFGTPSTALGSVSSVTSTSASSGHVESDADSEASDSADAGGGREGEASSSSAGVFGGPTGLSERPGSPTASKAPDASSDSSSPGAVGPTSPPSPGAPNAKAEVPQGEYSTSWESPSGYGPGVEGARLLLAVDYSSDVTSRGYSLVVTLPAGVHLQEASAGCVSEGAVVTCVADRSVTTLRSVRWFFVVDVDAASGSPIDPKVSLFQL